MPYAVELHFDEESVTTIGALSTQIHATYGGMDLVNSGGAPHISLALMETMDLARFQPLLATLAARVNAFPLAFAAVGTFPGNQGVVYLAPVVTGHLLTLHRDFYAQLATIGLSSNPLYHPGNWVPHCTVGYHLPADTIGATVHLCRQWPFPQAVTVAALRLIALHPPAHPVGGEAAPSKHTVEVLDHHQFATTPA